ncbi:MAG: radical SAM protein [Candidatus Pacebacteria bacterium]|nr:radical SAM protein [Candidatus Paceibacterota bacterium]
MDIGNTLKKELAVKAFQALSQISDENIIKFVDFVEPFISQDNKKIVAFIKNAYKEKTPALILTKRILSDIDKNCQKKFLENYVLPELLEKGKKREKSGNEGAAPLFTLLISPSMRCNLRCRGCYAQNYKVEDDLSFDIIDRIIGEAKEMGVSFFTILGGEPFIRDDIFEIFKKHSDAYFQVYTNSTLIDEKVAKKLIELGNVIPQISIEGFEEETDFRRGTGIYKKILNAMDILKKNNVPFGYSVCVTRKNAEVVMSDKFIDLMIEKGALMGWYFLYMPVCGDKNTELMPTPEQRNNQRIRRNHIRATKPIFIVDFWNDAPYVGGCIAANRYCHVNNFGDVEPCIFTHFAEANIKNTSLKEATKCNFFQEIRKRQPYDQNLLLPCMLIDHPDVSRELCQNCKVYPTHSGAKTLMEDIKDDLDAYSSEVHKIYDKVWEEEQKSKNNS